MKTITCATMGGPCDATMTTASEKEMMDKGWEHVMAAHPDMVEKMKDMPQEEKDAWAAKFHTTWESTPEDK